MHFFSRYQQNTYNALPYIQNDMGWGWGRETFLHYSQKSRLSSMKKMGREKVAERARERERTRNHFELKKKSFNDS